MTCVFGHAMAFQAVSWDCHELCEMAIAVRPCLLARPWTAFAAFSACAIRAAAPSTAPITLLVTWAKPIQVTSCVGGFDVAHHLFDAQNSMM